MKDQAKFQKMSAYSFLFCLDIGLECYKRINLSSYAIVLNPFPNVVMAIDHSCINIAFL